MFLPVTFRCEAEVRFTFTCAHLLFVRCWNPGWMSSRPTNSEVRNGNSWAKSCDRTSKCLYRFISKLSTNKCLKGLYCLVNKCIRTQDITITKYLLWRLYVFRGFTKGVRFRHMIAAQIIVFRRNHERTYYRSGRLVRHANILNVPRKRFIELGAKCYIGWRRGAT